MVFTDEYMPMYT